MDEPHEPYEEALRRIYAAVGEPVLVPKGALPPGFERLPRFVAEYLLAIGQRQGRSPLEVADRLLRLHPAPGDAGRFRHRLVADGELRLLDLLEVEVDVASGRHLAHLPSLHLKGVEVPAELVRRHQGLVAGGLWGRMRLVHAPAADGGFVARVVAFEPVQIDVSREVFLEARAYLTTRQWVDLLLTSAGYDPEGVVRSLTRPEEVRRRKLLLLARLLPLVEGNLNLLELGPKNTGKTYLLRNLTPRAYVLSGGRATAATLFENLATGRPGLVATRRVVVFDEIARLSFAGPEIVGILKDYMESGSFGRGRDTHASDASLVFLGNIDVHGDRPASRYRHLAEPLPRELRDSAFLDRIHGYLPGWELPKIGPEVLARGVGFASDFFGEALLTLRGLPYAETYAALVGEAPPLAGMTGRDRTAVERLARGFGKLVFPLGAHPAEAAWVDAVFRLAAELRQGVVETLGRIAPGEFRPHAVGWSGGREASPRRAAPPRLPRLRPGEAYFLDYHPLAEGGEARLRRVEVLASGAGATTYGPAFDREARLAVDVGHQFLVRHARLLGLGETSLAAGYSVNLEGSEPPADGVTLPVLLALISLLSGEAPPDPAVAVGEVSLHGDLAPPADLGERLRHLGLLAARALLVLPETDVPWRVEGAFTLVSARTFADLLVRLRAIRRPPTV